MRIDLKFDEAEITVATAINGIDQPIKGLTKPQFDLWVKCKPGYAFSTVHPKASWFNSTRIAPNQPAPTVAASMDGKSASGFYHWSEPRRIYNRELGRLQTFPDDFSVDDVGYIVGMSVPPFMMQRIADQIAKQFFRSDIISNELRIGPWNLTDLSGVKKNGLKVLSTFSCGGGSTMGYKLAGFEVIGCVEIDQEMADIYLKNHNPKYLYRMAIQQFNEIPDEELPKEFFDIDILDGSPPCSTFSMAGSREKKWGESNKFREGQANQILDDLFFHFIETTRKLRPKVVVAENVKGLILGNAKGYVKEIFKGFKAAGYETQLFLLNASKMGVPQRRERTFFIANRL